MKSFLLISLSATLVAVTFNSATANAASKIAPKNTNQHDSTKHQVPQFTNDLMGGNFHCDPCHPCHNRCGSTPTCGTGCSGGTSGSGSTGGGGTVIQGVPGGGTPGTMAPDPVVRDHRGSNSNSSVSAGGNLVPPSGRGLTTINFSGNQGKNPGGGTTIVRDHRNDDSQPTHDKNDPTTASTVGTRS